MRARLRRPSIQQHVDGPPANGRSLSRLYAGVLVTERATVVRADIEPVPCNLANDPQKRVNANSMSFGGGELIKEQQVARILRRFFFLCADYSLIRY